MTDAWKHERIDDSASVDRKALSAPSNSPMCSLGPSHLDEPSPVASGGCSDACPGHGRREPCPSIRIVPRLSCADVRRPRRWPGASLELFIAAADVDEPIVGHAARGPPARPTARGFGPAYGTARHSGSGPGPARPEPSCGPWAATLARGTARARPDKMAGPVPPNVIM
nr:unnamed protein product [Digitaria exilis]